MALRNIAYRILSNATDAAEALAKDRYFRETVGSFFDVVGVSCRYTMDLIIIEWWIQFGGDASHLRKVVIRVLSQTMTSSGCKHNWLTFAFTQVLNKLSYRRLEKLIYVHYNMRLRFQCVKLEKELKELEINTIDLQFYNKDSEPMLEWVNDTGKGERGMKFEKKRENRKSISKKETNSEQNLRKNG
ncbi:hypothetical protein BHE74_00059303 [Ensete ventricosum]|nr:hypothetical protein BHE74_00059303 [Ensete ventricosum]